MNNQNDNQNYRESLESHTDNDGNTHTNVTRTSEPVNNSAANTNYQSGYVHGQATEHSYQEQRLVQQDEDSTSRGLLLGLVLAFFGLIGGAVWYFNQNNTVDTTTTPAAAPTVTIIPTPVPTVTQPAQVQTQIIERTKEVQVPVPVIVPQQAPPTQTKTAPNVNITVPPATIPQSTTKPATSTPQATSAPKSSSNSSTTKKETNNSATTAPEQSPNTTKPDQEPNQSDTAPTTGSSTEGANSN